MTRRERKGRGGEVLPAIAEPEKRVPRRLRLEGEIFEALAPAVLELDDPRLEAVAVTRVQMTDDLQLVRVYVHRALGGADEKQQRDVLRGLRSAAGRLRRHLGQMVTLRLLPELRFFYDSGVDHARRVDELLAEIDAEKGAS